MSLIILSNGSIAQQAAAEDEEDYSEDEYEEYEEYDYGGCSKFLFVKEKFGNSKNLNQDLHFPLMYDQVTTVTNFGVALAFPAPSISTISATTVDFRHIRTSAATMPPLSSIFQNLGKTVVLAVLPRVAALTMLGNTIGKQPFLIR